MVPWRPWSSQTLYLTLFYGAKLKAMPPKLVPDDGRHIVIRPLAYCAEDDIAEYAAIKQFPIMPCNLCGSQDNLQRQAIKAIVADWERKTPGRIENTFRALTDVRPSQLADRTLFDFAALGARGDRSDAHGWLAGEAVDAEPAAARERVRTALSGLDILEA